MRSDICHSVSDGEGERFVCESIHIVRAEKTENLDQPANPAPCMIEQTVQQEKIEVVSLINGNGMQDDDRDNDNFDSASINVSDSLQKDREHHQSESQSSSAIEETGNAGDDGRLAYRKIFVGGLSWQTTEIDLREYFGQYGAIQSCQIKYDANSKQPRGFGFVVFEQEDSVDCVLAIRDQHRVRGKRVDPKPAKPSKDVSRKVFVGGIDPGATYEQILEYFSQFGKVESLDLPFDNAKCTRKNYVFIAYATKQEALAATRSAKQLICGRMCDVRIAVPRDQILKMQSRSTATGQPPLKFPAPQSPLPSACVYSRNFSGPAGTLTPVATPNTAALCNTLSIQPDLNFNMTQTRFRTPYRSEPGYGYQTATQFGGQVSPVTPLSTRAYAPQPTPPFHFALQGAPSALPSQFASPYQLCVMDQSVPQGVYLPYCAFASHECGVQPSMIAVPAYSTMMVGPGSPAQTGIMQPLVSPTAYAYQPYAAYADDVAVSQASTNGVFTVASPTTGNVESLAVAPGCAEVVQPPEVIAQPQQQLMAAPVQYTAAQQVVPVGMTYAPLTAQPKPSLIATTACIQQQQQQQPMLIDASQAAQMGFVPVTVDSGSSRKRPPNV